MSGRIILFDKYKKEDEKNNSGNGKRKVSSGLSTRELGIAAERDYFDLDGKEKVEARIRAQMHVLLSKPDEMEDGMRKVLEMAGLLRHIPPSALFPMQVGSTIYNSEEELREFMDEDGANRAIENRRQERAEAIPAYREWAEKLHEDIDIIAQARLSGAMPNEIITTDSVRMALSTEMASQTMIMQIAGTRRKVQQAIADLMNQADETIKTAPLARTMRQIGQYCKDMNLSLAELAIMTAEAVGGANKDPSGKLRSKVSSLTRRAREVFSPFIQDNHLITMEQLRDLEAFLHEAGDRNENVGTLIKDAIQAIEQAKQAGKHNEVRRIEKFIGFDQQAMDFERSIHALDNNFTIRAGILANVEAQNRTMLRCLPPHMLREAEIKSGLITERLLKRSEIEDNSLVLPANDDLELKQI